MSTSTFAQRLRDLLQERGIKQAELAKKVGTKQQTISYLMRSDALTQASRYTTKIADALGVNPMWLQTGEGDQYQPIVPLKQVDLFKDLCQIPIISCQNVLNYLSGKQGCVKGYLMTGISESQSRFAFEVSDNSMSPSFNVGDVVVIDPETSPQPGDFVVANPAQTVVVLRRFRMRDGGGFELVPENKDWNTMIGTEMSTILGVMVEHRRYWRR